MKKGIKKQILFATALLIAAFVIAGFTVDEKVMPITTKSDKARTLFMEARNLIFETGDMKKVTELLKQALELDSNFPLANLYYAYMGLGSIDHGKYVNAAYDQRNSVSESEKHFIQAYSAALKGNRDEAIDELKTAVSLAPGDKFLVMHLANMYVTHGKYEEALEYARQSCEMDPNSSGAVNYQGYILWRLDRPDEAEKLYVRSLEMNPGNTDFLNNYGQLLRSKGRIEDAISMHKKALAISEDYLSYLFLGHCYVADNNYTAARENYLKAKDVSVNNGQKNFCLFSVGTTCLYDGNLPEALAAFDKRIEFNRQLGGMDEYIIGTTLLKAYSCLLYEDFESYAKFSEEIKGYLTSLELTEADSILFSKQAILVDGFLYGYSGQTELAEKYLDKYEKSLTETEKDTYKQDLFELKGLIDYHKGNYKEAIDNFDKGTAMALYYAGLSYEKLGNIEKAKEIYQKISDNNLTSFDLAATKPFARKRLAQL